MIRTVDIDGRSGTLAESDRAVAGVRSWYARLVPESDDMLHLDMLRFVAATGVVWHHAHEFLVPVGERVALTQRTQALALFVDLFFVISGYVISFVYAARLRTGADYGRFLQRRIGRLIPLHWLTLAASFVLWTAIARGGFSVQHMPDRSAACVLHAALLLNGVFACGSGAVLNGVTWSISAEMVMYFLFPLLLFAFRRRAILPFCAASLAVALIVAQTSRWDQISPVLRAVPSFTFGMLLFKWREHLPTVRTSLPVLALTVALLILMVTGVSQYIVLTAVFSLAATAVATDRSRRAGIVVRFAAGLGQLTYGIYMWHMLFIVVLLNAVGDKVLGLRGVAMAVLIAFCYLAVVIWSFVSLRLFETPARRWIDRL